MPADFAYDVFLSHNDADIPRVRRLAERLKAAAVKPKAEVRRLKSAAPIHSSSLDLRPFRKVALKRSTAIHRGPTNTGRRFISLLHPTSKSMRG